jgi:hypothetical protein
MDNRLNDHHYREVARMTCEIIKNAQQLGLTFPLELNVTGADDDEVFHCTVSDGFKLENSSGFPEGKLGASFPISLTIKDSVGNIRDYMITAEDLMLH